MYGAIIRELNDRLVKSNDNNSELVDLCNQYNKLILDLVEERNRLEKDNENLKFYIEYLKGSDVSDNS